MTIKTPPFDMSDYLDSPEIIQEYIQAAIEDGNPSFNTINTVLKACGLKLQVANV